MGLKPKTQIILAGLLVGFCTYVIYDIVRELKYLRKANTILEANLEEKSRHANNFNLVCNELDEPMGEVVRLDCGESFSPRYATCACTLWCLEDYQFAVSNHNEEDCNKE